MSFSEAFRQILSESQFRKKSNFALELGEPAYIKVDVYNKEIAKITLGYQGRTRVILETDPFGLLFKIQVWVETDCKFMTFFRGFVKITSEEAQKLIKTALDEIIREG